VTLGWEVNAARGHAGFLQLDDHQRQAVDEADLIEPSDLAQCCMHAGIPLMAGDHVSVGGQV